MSRPPGSPQPRAVSWWQVTAAASLAYFLLGYNTTAVNVSIDDVSWGLALSEFQVSWFMSGYVLAVGMFTIAAGRIADTLGHPRVWVAGMLAFGASALATGLALDGWWAVVTRFLMGMSVALVAPAAVAIVSHSVAPERRGRALGLWAGISTFGLALGPVFGGLITEYLGWRWVFLVNVPLVLAGVGIMLRVRPGFETRAATRWDWPGFLLVAATPALLVAGFNQAVTGWLSAPVLILLFLGLLSAVLTAVVEWRTSAPLLDPRIFRIRSFSGGVTTGSFLYFVRIGLMFFLSLYMLQALGLSPVESGLLLLVWTGTTTLLSPLVGRLHERLAPGTLIYAGFLVLIAAVVLLLLTIDPADSWVTLLLPLALIGAGIALVYAPANAVAMSAMPDQEQALAGGMLSTFRQLGAAFGVAVLSSIFYGQRAANIDAGAVIAWQSGMRAVMLGCVVVLVLGLITALLQLRRPT
ncbi:MAG: MFS transporter [Actinobacteria bacterium]|nr:MFS transporter [Actinomycetota bacterium]